MKACLITPTINPDSAGEALQCLEAAAPQNPNLAPALALLRQLAESLSLPTPFNFDPGSERAIFAFDEPEAKGLVGVEAGGYGLRLYLPGFAEPVALVDLFYLSPGYQAECEREGSCEAPQLIIGDANALENVAFAQFFPTGTRVTFEFGAKAFRGRKAVPISPGEFEFGYRLLPETQRPVKIPA